MADPEDWWEEEFATAALHSPDNPAMAMMLTTAGMPTHVVKKAARAIDALGPGNDYGDEAPTFG